MKIIDSREPSLIFLAFCLILCSSHGVTAEDPVYAPAPEWVQERMLPEGTAAVTEGALESLLWDQQVHVDADGSHAYNRMAFRIIAPQGLMELNTLSAEWFPQFQTLAIHHVTIRRGEDVIDALGGGQTFTVLRRESNLELAMLDGALTAVLQPAGLRVGDIVDFAYTLSGTDPALGGMTQSFIFVPQFPLKEVRLRASWDRSIDIQWRATGALHTSIRESRGGGEYALEVDLENPEPVVPPTGAPGRYLIDPHIQLSSYSTWEEVSSQMAPLFERAVELSPDSLVQQEIDRIRAEYDSPVERASAALRMVQEEVRYLYVGLGYGGYVPASAEETWTRRFGDCKGKSALLLAILHGLGIEAEPVLVRSFAGDELPDILPMVGAFDHVIVRAVIDDKVYWMDGTSIGAGSIDRIVTPFFHWGLPIRARGGELVEVRPAALEEPDTKLFVSLDFSAGITAPGKFEGELVLSGPTAQFLRQNVSLMTAADAEQTYRNIWSSYYPAAEIESVEARSSSPSDEFVIAMNGTVLSLWYGRRYESILADLIFVRDVIERPPEQDQDAPYAVDFPLYIQVRETLTLPQNGEGFRIEGEDVDVTALGVHMTRSSFVDESAVVIQGSARSVQSEILASEVPSSRRRLAALNSRPLYVHAPTNYQVSPEEERIALGPDPVSAQDYIDRGIVHMDNGRMDLAIADFTSAIELAPENSYGWANRGIAYVWQRNASIARTDLEKAQALDPNNAVVYRAYGLLAAQQSNDSEAIEQFTRSIELDPESDFAYTMRANLRMSISDLDGAFEDSLSSTRLNPAPARPYFIRAMVQGLKGRNDRAMEELDDMLETATVDPATFRQAAQILARLGEQDRAIEAVSKAFDVQPTAGDLLMRAELRDPAEIADIEADLEAALEMESGLREARLRLARLVLDDGRAEEAISLLDELIERDSRDVEALGERGIALALTGEPELSDLDFDSARGAAHTGDALNSLCWRKATLNIALEHAFNDCMRALELEEDSAAFHDSLGLVLFRMGRFEEAIAAYDTALDISSGYSTSLAGRALAKRALGDREGYEQDMEDATSRNPGIEASFERFGIAF